MNATESPNLLRPKLRALRKTLTAAQQAEHALKAQKHLQALLETFAAKESSKLHPKKIALFLTQDGELSTQDALQYLWNETPHSVYLPVLETKPEWHMAFMKYSPDSPMKRNRFGILEPIEESTINSTCTFENHITGEALDIVLMPLVGFDSKGNRMGMGGGYYDRAFEFKLRQDAHTPPLLVGWAHSCQEVHALEQQPWDVPLNAIITELGIRQF